MCIYCDKRDLAYQPCVSRSLSVCNKYVFLCLNMFSKPRAFFFPSFCTCIFERLRQNKEKSLGARKVSIDQKQKQKLHTVYYIKQNAMCLDAVLLNAGRCVCVRERESLVASVYSGFFFFPTTLKGFTETHSEPEVAVSSHPSHCGRDVPCTKLQIVLKVDSANGFQRFAIILV